MTLLCVIEFAPVTSDDWLQDGRPTHGLSAKGPWEGHGKPFILANNQLASQIPLPGRHRVSSGGGGWDSRNPEAEEELGR